MPRALIITLCLVILAAALFAVFVLFKDDGGQSQQTVDYDVKCYEQGKVAAGYMAEGDALMDEARSIYNKLDEAETVLVAKLVSGQPVDVQESIEWIRTLEGKARASLAEAGTYYDKILGMHYVDDYAGYVRMQKDLINLYGELFAAQDVLIDGLTAGAEPGQLSVEQLQVITELTKDIDTATEYAREYQLAEGL